MNTGEVMNKMYNGEVLNIEEICREVKERERRIGIFASLTSPCCTADVTFLNESDAPRRKSVFVVMMKTLYSDFVVREMCAFHNHGKPLELSSANYLVTNVKEKSNKVNCADVETKEETDKNATCMKRERCTDVEQLTSVNDINNNIKQDINGENNNNNNDNNGNNDAKRVKDECNHKNNEFINDIKETLAPLLSEADVQRVVLFVTSNNSSRSNDKNNKNNSITLPDTVTLDKLKRTSVHAAIKSCMRRQYISSTNNGMICITVANAAMRREEERRSRPIRTRSFTHFTLYKENLDSAQVFRALARLLHVRTRQFSYCGTKDKRAVTLQRVAIQDIEPHRLASIVNNQRVSPYGTVRVCDFTIEQSALRLGDAMGNHFTIVLRCLPAIRSSTSISTSTSSSSCDINASTTTENNLNNSPNLTTLKETELFLASKGVINYYGPQRFGTTSILTSDIGVALLQGKYHEALRLIFASRACIIPAIRSVVDMVASRDYVGALAHTPHYCLQERDMLKYLIDNPNDVQGAFRVLPRTLAMLYFHAVQSLIWNIIASQRIGCHLYGKHNTENIESTNRTNENKNINAYSICSLRTKVEVGDLVLESVYKKRTRGHAIHTQQKCCDNGEICDEENTQVERTEENGSVDTTTNEEISDHATENNDEEDVDDVDDNSESIDEKCKLPTVHWLNVEDELTLFDLTDVLLPLPGPDLDLHYPESAGCTYADYKELMAKWGVLTGLLNVEDEASSTDNCDKNYSAGRKYIVNNALVKMFHFHGAYRPLCVKPQNVEIYLDSVDGWRTPVTRTDLQLLDAKGTDSNNKEHSEKLNTNGTENDVNTNILVNDETIAGVRNNTIYNDDNEVKKKNDDDCDGGDKNMVDVIVCKFSLPAGSYATSVLREIAIVCPDNQHVNFNK